MKKYFLLLLLISICLSSCRTELKNVNELLAWMDHEENGLIKKKNYKQFELSMKFLPAEYLAYNELGENANKGELDSLLDYYKSFRTFLFTIKYANEGENALNYNVISYDDYKQRVLDFNFLSRNYFNMETDRGELKPVLSGFENLYNIDRDVSFYIVFVDDNNDKGLMTSNTLDISYRDEIFGTGVSHFVFQKDDLDNLPKMKFLK